jgi:hypothetical protein
MKRLRIIAISVAGRAVMTRRIFMSSHVFLTHRSGFCSKSEATRAVRLAIARLSKYREIVRLCRDSTANGNRSRPSVKVERCFGKNSAISSAQYARGCVETEGSSRRRDEGSSLTVMCKLRYIPQAPSAQCSSIGEKSTRACSCERLHPACIR